MNRDGLQEQFVGPRRLGLTEKERELKRFGLTEREVRINEQRLKFLEDGVLFLAGLIGIVAFGSALFLIWVPIPAALPSIVAAIFATLILPIMAGFMAYACGGVVFLIIGQILKLPLGVSEGSRYGRYCIERDRKKFAEDRKKFAEEKSRHDATKYAQKVIAHLGALLEKNESLHMKRSLVPYTDELIASAFRRALSEVLGNHEKVEALAAGYVSFNSAIVEDKAFELLHMQEQLMNSMILGNQASIKAFAAYGKSPDIQSIKTEMAGRERSVLGEWQMLLKDVSNEMSLDEKSESES